MQFYKFMHYTMSVSIGLLMLIFLEGMMTLGTAFDFDNYTWFNWFIQVLFVVATVNLSLIVSFQIQENNK